MTTTDSDGIHTCNPNCPRPACIAVREAATLKQKGLIRMAREAGWQYADGDKGYSPLWRFAALVEAASATAEREACAQVCDDLPVPPYVPDNDAHIWDLTCVDCAAAIRARGQQ